MVIFPRIYAASIAKSLQNLAEESKMRIGV
jgi:hypothetical protein